MTNNAQGSADRQTVAGGAHDEKKQILEQIAELESPNAFLTFMVSLNDDQKRMLAGDDVASFIKAEMDKRSNAQQGLEGGAQQTAGAALVNMTASSIGAILRSPLSLAKGASGVARMSVEKFREGRIKRAYMGQDDSFKRASKILGDLSEVESFANFVMENQNLGVSAVDLAKEMRPGGKYEARLKDFNSMVADDPQIKSMLAGLSDSVDAFGRDGADLVHLTGKYPRMSVDVNGIDAPIAAQGMESMLAERGQSLDKALSSMPLPEFDEKGEAKSFKAVSEKLEEMMESIKKLIETLKSLVRLK